MDSPKNSSKDTQPAGRVKHDASGRAIWEWAAETGKHALDSTSRLLKRLDLPGLKLADEPKQQQKEPELPADLPHDKAVPTFGGQREKDPLAHNRKSFNPYDNRTPIKRALPKTPAPPRATQPPAPRPGLLARIFGRSR
jgi:hypothetical protein